MMRWFLALLFGSRGEKSSSSFLLRLDADVGLAGPYDDGIDEVLF